MFALIFVRHRLISFSMRHFFHWNAVCQRNLTRGRRSQNRRMKSYNFDKSYLLHLYFLLWIIWCRQTEDAAEWENKLFLLPTICFMHLCIFPRNLSRWKYKCMALSTFTMDGRETLHIHKSLIISYHPRERFQGW